MISKDFVVDSEMASRWKSGSGWSCFSRICEWVVMRFSSGDVVRSFGDGFDWLESYSSDLLSNWSICSGIAGVVDSNGGGVVFFLVVVMKVERWGEVEGESDELWMVIRWFGQCKFLMLD